jgi:hypothetical protein
LYAELQVVCSFKTLVTSYQTARFINAEGHILKGMTNLVFKGRALWKWNLKLEPLLVIRNVTALMFCGYYG